MLKQKYNIHDSYKRELAMSLNGDGQFDCPWPLYQTNFYGQFSLIISLIFFFSKTKRFFI